MFGVEIYFDHIIIAACDEATHYAIMFKVLEGSRSLNREFHPEKFRYRTPEIKYLGQIIFKSGVNSDSSYIKEIVDTPTLK